MSSSEHIVIHLQTIDDKHYIRIVCTDNTKKYFNEVDKAYKTIKENASDNVPEATLHNGTCSNVFYNSADLYPRLIHDVNYKKFKNVDKIVTICPNLWHVEGVKIDINDWYTDEFIPYISNKISSYIEDANDENYFSIDEKTINWKEVREKQCLTCVFEETLTLYQIQHFETSTDGMVILTRDHFLAIIFQFVYNNFCIICSNTEESEQFFNVTYSGYKDLEVKYCQHSRGVFLNKSALTTEDVIILLSFLQIKKDALSIIPRCKEYIQILEADIMVNDISYESDPFQTWYSFYEIDPGTTSTCIYSCDTAFLTVPYEEKKALDQINGVVQDGQCVALVKNILKNNIVLFDEEIKYLSEFKKLSMLLYKDTITSSVLSVINNQPIGNDFVKELKQLVRILEINFDTECKQDIKDTLSANIPHNIGTPKLTETHSDVETPIVKNLKLQKLYTKQYVDTMKNDNVETLASVVVENVYQYLLKDCHLTMDRINKNQIGKDLFDLGVTKTRKSKGYVYGIEDTSKKGEKYDYMLTAKQNYQMRADEPVTPVQNVSCWLKPARYIIPETI